MLESTGTRSHAAGLLLGSRLLASQRRLSSPAPRPAGSPYPATRRRRRRAPRTPRPSSGSSDSPSHTTPALMESPARTNCRILRSEPTLEPPFFLVHPPRDERVRGGERVGRFGGTCHRRVSPGEVGRAASRRLHERRRPRSRRPTSRRVPNGSRWYGFGISTNCPAVCRASAPALSRYVPSITPRL